MNYLKILCFLILSFTFSIPSRGIVPLEITDIPQAMINAPQTYDGESLWGYIDGGADIFLEYGFQSLMVQELIWNSEKIKVEVYLMKTPEGAFGIYSTSVIKCQQRDTLNNIDCVSRFQYQSAYGKLYITVTSESGSPGAQKLFFPIVRMIMQKNPQEVLEFPDVFTQDRMLECRKNLVYLQGSLGLQNSLFPWQNLLLGIHFGMYAIMIPDQVADIYFARITFPDIQSQMRFLTAAGMVRQYQPIPNVTTPNGMYREFQQLDARTIYFLERQEPYSINTLIHLMK